LKSLFISFFPQLTCLPEESRGFGFVMFETNEEAENAITTFTGTTVEGRVVTVTHAKRSRARTPTPGRYHGVKFENRGFGGPGGGGGGRFGGGYEDRPYQPRSYDSRYSDRGPRGHDDRRGGGGYDDRRGGGGYDDRRGGGGYDDRRGGGGYDDYRRPPPPE
jgi:transformer-2 protein